MNQVKLNFPKPFLKWAGGKTQLLCELTPRLPPKFNRYYEAFIGGGALFFHLCPHTAYISDLNEELINVYQVIKNDIEALIASLNQHIYDKDYYYQQRHLDRNPEYPNCDQIERASRFIYLNRTGYNGLYRVNSKGEFNVPFGKYKNPKISDPVNLRLCSAALQTTEIKCASFLEIESHIQGGDFVYFDPPYEPLTINSSFTSYSSGGFKKEDQIALRDLCIRLDQKGVYWMLSNSSAPLIFELYKDYEIEIVEATRMINSKITKRGKIKELIIRNYNTIRLEV